MSAPSVAIVEVGPRDGLQNQKTVIPTAAKVAFIDALSATGVGEIEVSAFVSPRWVPQLSDAEEVWSSIRRAPGVVYSGLVPNARGLERALAAKVGKVAVFTAASESFNRANINASIAESLTRFEPVVEKARRAGLTVRGYVSTAFWCPFEGRIAPDKAVAVVRELFDLGVDEVSVGDTIGRAKPDEVKAFLDLALLEAPARRLAMHFHDTFGHAAANVRASLALGVTTFDSSAGGLGGCPYAPGAPGNVATETVVRVAREAGFEVGCDLDLLTAATATIAPWVARR